MLTRSGGGIRLRTSSRTSGCTCNKGDYEDLGKERSPVEWSRRWSGSAIFFSPCGSVNRTDADKDPWIRDIPGTVYGISIIYTVLFFLVGKLDFFREKN